MAEKTKKTAVKKTTVKKTTTKKVATKKTTVKKVATKKVAKKIATKKVAKKTTTKKVAKKTTTRKIVKKVAQSLPDDPTIEVVKKCWKVLDDKKAEDLKVLDVRGRSPITNYFIVATATSEPHLHALSNELDKTLKELGIKSVGREYNPGSGWVVVDGFDFMAHIFLPEQRGMYGIEALWKDAEILEI
jgi:ribosome-associated protein